MRSFLEEFDVAIREYQVALKGWEGVTSYFHEYIEDEVKLKAKYIDLLIYKAREEGITAWRGEDVKRRREIRKTPIRRGEYSPTLFNRICGRLFGK